MVSNHEIKEKLRKRREGREKKGYLICNTCRSFYELKSGENPEDFEDTCECGGKFEYKKQIFYKK
jgi:hypothetical protein